MAPAADGAAGGDGAVLSVVLPAFEGLGAAERRSWRDFAGVVSVGFETYECVGESVWNAVSAVVAAECEIADDDASGARGGAGRAAAAGAGSAAAGGAGGAASGPAHVVLDALKALHTETDDPYALLGLGESRYVAGVQRPPPPSRVVSVLRCSRVPACGDTRCCTAL